jgi:hypothetical protein
VMEEDTISFAAGPITADTARVLFEGVARACAARDPDEVLFAHVKQGVQSVGGVMVTFYPVVEFKPEPVARQATLEGDEE